MNQEVSIDFRSENLAEAILCSLCQIMASANESCADTYPEVQPGEKVIVNGDLTFLEKNLLQLSHELYCEFEKRQNVADKNVIPLWLQIQDVKNTLVRIMSERLRTEVTLDDIRKGFVVVKPSVH